MADGFHNRGRAATLNALRGLGLFVVLLDTAYTDDPDHGYVSDVSAHELSTGGYAGGFGSAGRIYPSFSAATVDDSTNSAALPCASIAWAHIGAPAGVAVGHLMLCATGNDDTDSAIIARFAVSATLNGGAFTLTIPAPGLIQSP